ncbi:NAD-dependent epimerase/dehydratase family protein [Actinopolyspora mortivallis]|uniref:NAD-dependent epimerase/dehydratase family protein n=1 Tax=Actinopolyspora mortivallis TaxID=33906 RepID=UPI0003A1234D|nr:NAD-dependent epimerase/dehydratase family protein [Actinopolyspora mortivallis]
MSRFVVTGGCGFIGSHLVERLLARGDDVVVVDAAPWPHEHDPARHPGTVRHVRVDVRVPEQLTRVVPERVEAIFHLAATVGVDRYLDRPLEVVDTALEGTRNVPHAAERTGAKVVLASTSEVYGRNPDVPWHEDDDRVLGSTTAHRWCYSTSKALAEHVTFAFARLHGLRATVLRYFNVYGPGQRPAFVISRGVHRALRGVPPVVYDDGGQTRCFTFVDDAVEATLRAASTPAADGLCLNIGGSDETSVREVVETRGKMRCYDAGLAINAPSADDAQVYYGNFEEEFRNFWNNSNYYSVLAGLGYLPDKPLPKLRHMPEAVETVHRVFDRIRDEQKYLLNTLPSCHEYLKAQHTR